MRVSYLLLRARVEECPAFLFFQAEAGIRDPSVTGVQTCALPIYTPQGSRQRSRHRKGAGPWEGRVPEPTGASMGRSRLQGLALSSGPGARRQVGRRGRRENAVRLEKTKRPPRLGRPSWGDVRNGQVIRNRSWRRPEAASATGQSISTASQASQG